MVWHQVPLNNLALLLLRQRMKDRTQLLTSLPEDGFPPSFGHEYYVVLAVPFLNGMGFDKFQAFSPLFVGHQATWRGFHSCNGQTSSCLTGRTSGLSI